MMGTLWCQRQPEKLHTLAAAAMTRQENIAVRSITHHETNFEKVRRNPHEDVDFPE